MKRNYLFAFASLSFLAFGSLQAQVVNGNFESIKDNNLVSNWGMNYSIPISIDVETGENTTDMIAYGSCMPAFVFGTADPHSGDYAMQISNGLNMTQNQVIAAKAEIFNDATQDFPGWNSGVPVSATDQVTMLGFYYKFFPMGETDKASAELILLDENGDEMGRASALITDAAFNYTYLYAPVQLTHSGTPTHMFIRFSMDVPDSNPTFGSALVIDDVFVNFAALSQTQFETAHFGIYPTLADSEINVVRGNQSANGAFQFKITDLEGKTVQQINTELIGSNPTKIDVSGLPKGIYLISSNGYTTKFAKK
ncbi:MAG: T9SS type A sorting domain-containing protein [Bacteroidetes bacterium]|nr:T9SS type A sorting domain-containing protein [Bacteroidota bacterium]